MSLPVKIEALLTGQTVESDRVEFKEGWNPDSIYRSICAFANDFDNIGGGYIIIGVKARSDHAERPVKGLSPSDIAKIQKEMIGYNNLIRPSYAPRLSIEHIDEKDILVLWIPGGNDRPYEVPEIITVPKKSYKYYIRRYASTIEARGRDKENLIMLASQIPFDDRTNRDALIKDIDLLTLREFLRQSGSRLADEAANLSSTDLLSKMDLLSGPQELTLLRNAALLLFTEHPEKFFPQIKIDLVQFKRGPADRDFNEKSFEGPVQTQIRQTLEFIQSSVLIQKVIKVPGKAEALRPWNYPYEAIEEALVNAVYHRNYQEREPISVRIEADTIIIYNVGGPDRSISLKDLQKGKTLPHRYRNRRLGDFLKEMNLTEGRATGLPLIKERLKKNGSPSPLIETDEERSWFKITFRIHPAFKGANPVEESNEGKDSALLQLLKDALRADDLADDLADDMTITNIINIIHDLQKEEIKQNRILENIGLKHHTDNIKRYIVPLEHIGWIEKTIPDKPTSPNQKYRLTVKARKIIEKLK